MVEKYTSKRTFCTILDPKILVPEGKIGSFLYIFQTLTQICKKKRSNSWKSNPLRV